MFEYLLKLVQGFCKIEATGNNLKRFLNLCQARDILIWDIDGFDEEKESNKVHFFISSNRLEEMNVPAEKTNTAIDIVKEYGLRFFLKKNKKRVCFVAGILMFVFLLFFQSLFIWKINIDGETDYTKDEILKHVTNTYVKLGTRKSKINCDTLEKNLRNDFQDISWISCSITGTVLTIDINEALNIDTNTKVDYPCNIIAAKDAVVDNIVTAKGTPVATKGDSVKAGDILISGAVYLYDDNNEVLDTNYVVSEGEIWGICTYDYYKSTELAHYEKQYTGKEKKYYSLRGFDYCLTFFVPNIRYQYYDVEADTSTLHVGDSYYLPFGCTKYSVREYALKLDNYTETEAIKREEERLARYICELQEKGVQIMQNNVKISVGDTKCIAEGTIVTKELIGIPHELEIVNKEEETIE